MMSARTPTPSPSTAQHVALVGFMGSGKSSVGKLLASRLRRPFIDLDEVIEAEAGQPVSEIFRLQGEVAFRAKERAALRRVLASDEAMVLAVGGGTFSDGSNRETLRSAITVYLETSVEEIIARIGQGEEKKKRPLLRGPSVEDTVSRLLTRREMDYRRASASVVTDGQSVEAVTEEIVRALGLERRALRNEEFGPGEHVDEPSIENETPAMTPRPVIAHSGKSVSVRVETSSHDYSVFIRPHAGAWIANGIAELCKGNRIVVLTDTTVGKLHSADLIFHLKATGKEVSILRLEPGEGSKTLGTASRVYDFLLDQGLTRSDMLVALGGGVIGDLTGFVASTFLRGCQFVQVPTTTLAVMDSSVGGKTAVNTPRGKNLVGTFYQPQGVFVALSHLATQSSVEHAAGLVEGVKMALTLDADVYQFMTKSSRALVDFSEDELTKAIAEAVRLKAKIVKADEFESGVRAVLNYGHTVGHAIEAGESFKMLHGQAVALGMIAEAQWAEMEGYSRDISSSLRDVVEDLGLRSDWRRSKISTDAITLDKKRKGGGIQLPIVSSIGSFDLRTITVSALVEFVKRRSGA